MLKIIKVIFLYFVLVIWNVIDPISSGFAKYTSLNRFEYDIPDGFLYGLWHGLIFPFALVVSLF